MFNNKKKSLAIIGTLLIIFSSLGASYAFNPPVFTARNQTSSSIKTKEIGLTFNGETDLDNIEIVPGGKYTKTFNVEANYDETQYFNMYMEDVVNDYGNDVVYTLYETDSTYTTVLSTVISQTKLPDSRVGKQYLISNVEIGANSKKYYKLEIDYLIYDNELQTYDESATFTGTLGIDYIEQLTKYTLTIDPNGGVYDSTTENTVLELERGATYTLLTPTRAGYEFLGWDVSIPGVIDNNVVTMPEEELTLTATWKDLFPEVFAYAGPCTFNGSSTNITGANCTDYNNKKYIDTGVYLYNDDNWKKDYEIKFTIDAYVPTQQVQQAVFVNTKYENKSLKWPGLVFRRENTGDNLEITQSINNGNKVTASITEYTLPLTVRIVRKNKIIYYALNDGELIEFQDMSNFNQQFDVTTWFGAAPDQNGTMMRNLKGTLSNMSIRLGTYPE